MIAYRFTHNLSNIIYSCDSDYAALIGPTCIMMKDVIVENDEKNPKFILGGASNKVMMALKQKIGNNDKLIKWETSKYTFFENDDPQLRALIALSLGCDVFIGGIKGCGCGEIDKQLRKGMNTPSLFQSMMINKLVGRKRNASQDMGTKYEADLDALVKAFLYEPAMNINDDINDAKSWKYIHDTKPSQLPNYLHSFGCKNENDISFIDGPELHVCKGVNNDNKHSFLSSIESSFVCCKCASTFCQTCGVIPSDIKTTKEKDANGKTMKNGKQIINKIYYRDEQLTTPICLDCYKETSLGTSDSMLSLNEIEMELQERGVNIPNNTTASEISDLYDLYIEKPDVIKNLINEKIRFPIYEPLSFYRDESDIGKKLGSFAMKNGGHFINDKDLISDEIVPSVIDLLSTFVCYDRDDSLITHLNESDVGKYADTMPTYLLNFAFESRINSGYRLLDRCARHAMDPKTPSLKDCEIEIRQLQNGDVVFVIETDVYASMKKASYQVKVAVSKDKLLACQCNCKAGGQGRERVVCVHVLPVLLLMTIAICKSFGLHFLIELGVRWDPKMTLHDKNLDNVVKKSINHICQAVGFEQIDPRFKTVGQMLQDFKVGTENRKKFQEYDREPTKDEYKPLREMCFVSNNTMLQKSLQGANDNQRSTVLSESNQMHNTSKEILKKVPGGALAPISCNFCNTGNTTSHVCRKCKADGNRVIEGDEENPICGLAFCFECMEKAGTENNNICFLCNDNVADIQPIETNAISQEDQTEEVSDNQSTFHPDPFETMIAIEACRKMGKWKSNLFDFIGFNLLHERSRIKTKDSRLVKRKINDLKFQWKLMKDDAQNRVKKKVDPRKPRSTMITFPSICNPCDIIDDSSTSSPTKRKETSTPDAPLNNPPSKKKQKMHYHKCCFPKCNNNDSMFGIKLRAL